jgi:hypothetical protein
MGRGRGARADEMKKRLQAEGLIPNGKAKSEEPLKLKFIDEKGGIVTKRDVKLLNTATLYGEQEKQ